jgi:putative two-component system response regulator
MDNKLQQARQEILRLAQIGIALTSVQRLDELLELIVSEARSFTAADAGSLYLRQGDRLVFAVAQNDTLKSRLGKEQEKAPFISHSLPLALSSIAGYVAVTRQDVNLPDVYQLDPGLPFSFNPEFDRQIGYRTCSVLAVPMVDRSDNLQGVLQLINAREGDKTVPFRPEKVPLVRSLASQAAVAVNNARLTEELKKLHLDTIYRLSMAAEYKDKDTAGHIKRMSHTSALLARALGWNSQRVELMLYAAPMHDIGKIGIPDAVLLKPGRLTPEEFKVIQSHTEIGAHILKGSDSELLQLSEEVALCHHEKWNGSGYPRGLKDESIPLAGRIVAVADVFDALCSRRPYKKALTHEEAFAIIRQDSGTHFDPTCVEAFSGILDQVREIYARFSEENSDTQA